MFDLTQLMDYLPHEMSPEYRAQFDRVTPYYQKIEEAPSPEFFREYWNAYTTLGCIECDERFVQGLRLGAQITVQLLCPPPPTRSPRP